MKGIAVVILGLCVALPVTWAGRAFPVAAENFATSEFQKVNPLIEWDPTNFLVDLSGQYALCKHVGRRGTIKVDRNTPEDGTIGGLIDSYPGSATDAPSVNEYLFQALPAWLYESPFADQIRKAERFGCSVQPGCSGNIAIACVFSPSYSGAITIEEPQGNPDAQAFTPQQYNVAASITNTNWDRSHFLENLSGFETDCTMVVQSEWFFPNAKKVAKKNGMSVEGKYGVARNNGETEPGIKEILESWKWLPSKQVGCSVIPDCMVDADNGRGRKMYVVVSCVFEQ